MEKEIEVKYKKGFPTQKCIRELIVAFWGETLFAPRISSYGFNGSLIWDRPGVNEKIDSFASFLNESGVEVKDYHLYDSPRTGQLFLQKKN